MAQFAKELSKLAIGVIGQSNEAGSVDKTADFAAYPQAFKSLINPAVALSLGPKNGLGGGWWYKVYDDLRDYGYETKIVNGGIGSMSMITHACGRLAFRSGGAVEGFARRASAGGRDRGFAGTKISPVRSGTDRVWVATVARNTAAMGDSPSPVMPGGVSFDADFDGITNTGETLRTSGAQITASFSGGTMTVTAVNTAALAVNQYIYGFATGFANVPAGLQITGLGTGTGGTGTYTVSDGAFSSASGFFTTSTANFATGAVGSTVVDGDLTWTCESLTNSAYGGAYGNGSIWSETQIGRGFDPYGILHKTHEEMMRVQADRKIIYIQNGQSDVTASQTEYSTALQNVATFFLNRGYEVMIGLTCYDPHATTGQYNTLQAARTAALTALRAVSADFLARTLDGADLYASMGSTGPMASGGAFFRPDNVHLNGAGAVGPDVSGVPCAAKVVSNALKAVLTDRRPLTI